ncbi:maf protein [Spiribacter salinus M19-40]|uniref:7-methyl-GTP pyrophosphatase n=1 Tax=Spiribacter salinus M19-40 TaxID=1260251 RepID=R4VMW2_9GAMM|nr:nucleoside triphosphate pyrophosphatase [Spiribacter salinus]AGM40913.1 maf protein [Spiribacter salinus M19-40]MBY5268143.1 septum formation protein Maf [Spiribacter salinus]
MAPLVLASGSPYRAQLLARLGLEFTQRPADLDEAVLPGESPEDYVCRLAREKSEAVAAHEPEAIIIGSDQCSECQGQILGKPLTEDAAIAQLANASGQRVTLWTAVAVRDPSTGRMGVAQVPTHVQFRRLGHEAIRRYVQAEQPLDCAGAFRAEGLGIALFERIEGDDPNALIGLPMIALVRLLSQVGVVLP